MLAVIGGKAALAGVVGELPALAPLLSARMAFGLKRAEAHGRDVEDRSIVGPGAIRPADLDAERRRRQRPRHHRMADPFEAFRVDVVLGPERPLVEHHLGALVDHRPLVAAERHPLLFVLEEILAHLGPHLFEQKAQMGRDRIVAQHRMAGLKQVVGAEHRQPGEHRQRDGCEVEGARIGQRWSAAARA